MYKMFFILLFSSLYISKAFGLVPLEGIILGRLEDNQTTNSMQFLFTQKVENESLSTIKSKKQIQLFLGHYFEGQNLKNYCDQKHTLLYSSPWKQIQAKRGVYSTLQYLGLDITMQAIGQYAKSLNYSKDQFELMVNNLTGNYCSKNISSISQRNLKLFFLDQYSDNKYFSLPNIQDNDYFDDNYKKVTFTRRGLQQEFALTLELFKTFCSWGNDVDNLRLMVPLVKDPYVMAYVFNHLTKQSVKWDAIKNKPIKVYDKDTTRLACEGLICRKRDDLDFEKLLPQGIGSKDRDQDFKRLYCAQLQEINYSYDDQAPELLVEIRNRTLDEDKLLQSQFFALISNIPDPVVHVQKFNELNAVFKNPTESHFKNWAKKANDSFSKDLLFEDSLTIEKVDRSFYFTLLHPQFKVVFDVNLGEIDRTTVMNNKLKIFFPLKMSKSFLKYMRNEWNSRGIDKEFEKNIVDRFVVQIENEVKKNREKFIIPPWEGHIESIIAKEILEQITRYKGKFWESELNQMIEIPVEFNYGPFALKYFHYRRNSAKNHID